MAYGARLESVLGESPRGFESPLLRVNALATAPEMHQWLDKLSPDQTEHLRVVIEYDEVLPPLNDSPEATNPALETWLRNIAAPATEAVKAGQVKMYSYDEALAFIAADDDSLK